MAKRPVFHPSPEGDVLSCEVTVEFTWHGGMSMAQKKRNVAALHAAAAAKGIQPLLEVSTRSDDELGRRLSAFSLKVSVSGHDVPFESAYQASKVFEYGGPYTDLLTSDPVAAKADQRLRQSGRIVGFEFEGTRYANEPATAFYDWLYIRTLYPHRDYLKRLDRYDGFTDIAFNPERSLSTQARSCAIFVSLQHAGLLTDAVQSFGEFVRILVTHGAHTPSAVEPPRLRVAEFQGDIFHQDGTKVSRRKKGGGHRK